MEHNKRKIIRTGGAGYRIRETAWLISGYRKRHYSYGKHSTQNGNISRYSTRFEVLKIVASGILTVSMILLFVLVIRILL
jgi:hypothetical protein